MVNIREVPFHADGLRLAGEFYLPEAASELPGLCICHGIPAVPFNPEDRGYAELAMRFAEAGFATLLFNFRGTGLSEGNFDMRGWARDLEAALSHLAAMNGVDASSLYVMGFSGGAATALVQAARDGRIAGVVSCASPAHFQELTADEALKGYIARWREIDIIRDPSFPQDMEDWKAGFSEVAPVSHIGKIAPRPVLLLHGDADEVVDVSHAHVLMDASGPNCELVVLPGALHRLRVDERAMVLALDWLLRQRVG